MKISELISKLQSAQSEYGDVNVEISVSDYFTQYGHRAEILESASDWNATTFFDAMGNLRINANLRKDITGANPKVTFRK